MSSFSEKKENCWSNVALDVDLFLYLQKAHSIPLIWRIIINKRTYVREEITTFIRKFTKRFPLILIESTWRDRNPIRPKISSYKCTLVLSYRIISSSKKPHRIHPRYLVKWKTDESYCCAPSICINWHP